MPVRLTLCDLGAPSWGQPWFPLRAVLLLSQLYGEVVFVSCSVAFVSRHTNPFDYAKVIISPCWPSQLFNAACVFCFLFFRNPCQMKHTHASGRRWENCFGCHRYDMT